MIKTNSFKFVTLCLCALVLSVTSCKKEKDDSKPPVPQAKTVKNKNIKEYTKWYYFSFSKGEFVGEGNITIDTIQVEIDGINNDSIVITTDDAAWKERTDWDIAFHRANVRTNGGLSGNGKAGIMYLDTDNFDEIKEVPNSDFIMDTEYSKFLLNMPPIFATSNLNMAVNKWAVFEHETMAWSMAKTNVFIVKTADGKYAKVQFVNFLNDIDESGFLTFKYVYQPDGSKKF